MFDDCFNDCLV